MRNVLSHRWFHALVVTGAAITACGRSTDDSTTDASADTLPDSTNAPDATAMPDAAAIDAGSSDGDAGDINEAGDAGDVRNDPRCCIITH